MRRREFCESAKKGKICVDDLCHGPDQTLCGFDLDEYNELTAEEEDFNCYFDDEAASETGKGEQR